MIITGSSRKPLHANVDILDEYDNLKIHFHIVSLRPTCRVQMASRMCLIYSDLN